MKAAAVTLILAAGIILQPLAEGMSFPHRRAEITLQGFINYPYISHHGGTAYLQITLTTSDFRPVQRRPMNISIVLDRSGSMGDERKMEHAKSALYALINQLERDDIFSLVIYDEEVDVIRSARKVGNSKSEIRRLVERVYPRGSTNLGGGLLEGLRQVERNASREYANRVILLSDGLANRGITDSYELNRIARRHRSRSISVTTMGVGLDYNENLMVGLSESGGGNYYFIESSYGLAEMLQREFNTLSSVLAQNSFIELAFGRGVRVSDVIGCEYRNDRGKYVIPVGDLYVNDRREFTVELNIPEGSGSFVAAQGVLRLESADAKIGRVEPFAVKIHYTRDAALIERNRDREAQAKADIAVSTRNVERALKAVDEGKVEEAAAMMSDGFQSLSASPVATEQSAVGAAVRGQMEKLRSYSDTLQQNKDDSRRAKKAIQFENYKTQKNR